MDNAEIAVSICGVEGHPTWTHRCDIYEENKRRYSDQNADEVRLEGIALTIWEEVVYRGETITLHRDTRPVAVVVPFDEYEEMRRLIDGYRAEDISVDESQWHGTPFALGPESESESH